MFNDGIRENYYLYDANDTVSDISEEDFSRYIKGNHKDKMLFYDKNSFIGNFTISRYRTRKSVVSNWFKSLNIDTTKYFCGLTFREKNYNNFRKDINYKEFYENIICKYKPQLRFYDDYNFPITISVFGKYFNYIAHGGIATDIPFDPTMIPCGYLTHQDCTNAIGLAWYKLGVIKAKILSLSDTSANYDPYDLLMGKYFYMCWACYYMDFISINLIYEFENFAPSYPALHNINNPYYINDRLNGTDRKTLYYLNKDNTNEFESKYDGPVTILGFHDSKHVKKKIEKEINYYDKEIKACKGKGMSKRKEMLKRFKTEEECKLAYVFKSMIYKYVIVKRGILSKVFGLNIPPLDLMGDFSGRGNHDYDGNNDKVFFFGDPKNVIPFVVDRFNTINTRNRQ